MVDALVGIVRVTGSAVAMPLPHLVGMAADEVAELVTHCSATWKPWTTSWMTCPPLSVAGGIGPGLDHRQVVGVQH